MALIECGECGNSYSDQINACIHCGASPQKKQGNGCFYVVCIAAVLVMMSTFIERPPHAAGEDKFSAFFHCNSFVNDKLKSPSTSEFPSFYDKNVSGYADDTYIVRSYVDAKNSFNAVIRTEFTCEVKREDNGDRWLLMKLTM